MIYSGHDHKGHLGRVPPPTPAGCGTRRLAQGLVSLTKMRRCREGSELPSWREFPAAVEQQDKDLHFRGNKRFSKNARNC